MDYLPEIIAAGVGTVAAATLLAYPSLPLTQGCGVPPGNSFL